MLEARIRGHMTSNEQLTILILCNVFASIAAHVQLTTDNTLRM